MEAKKRYPIAGIALIVTVSILMTLMVRDISGRSLTAKDVALILQSAGPIIAVGALYIAWVNIQLSHRAWVSIKVPEINGIGIVRFPPGAEGRTDGNEQYILDLACDFENSGKTPAKDLDVRFELMHSQHHEPIVEYANKWDGNGKGWDGFDVPPNGKFGGNFEFMSFTLPQLDEGAIGYRLIVCCSYRVQGYKDRKKSISIFDLRTHDDGAPYMGYLTRRDLERGVKKDILAIPSPIVARMT
jgi:hypothetical protein